MVLTAAEFFPTPDIIRNLEPEELAAHLIRFLNAFPGSERERELSRSQMFGVHLA
jgi:hypothetical protein